MRIIIDTIFIMIAIFGVGAGFEHRDDFLILVSFILWVLVLIFRGPYYGTTK